MELGEIGEHVGHVLLAREEGEADVVGARSLTETRTGDGADAGSLEELVAVEDVGGLFLGVGSVDGLGGEEDGGEGVHGTVGGVAGDARKGVEGGNDQFGSALERRVDVVAFRGELFERGVAGFGGIDHEGDHELSEDVGAQVDGAEFVVFVHDVLCDAVHLDVATALAALSEESLGDGMEGEELERSKVWAHIVFYLLEREEWLFFLKINILLVYLISKKNNSLLVTEPYNLLHIVKGKNLSSWVAWIYDNQCSRYSSLRY